MDETRTLSAPSDAPPPQVTRQTGAVATNRKDDSGSDLPQVPEYEVLGLLGRGGFGVVYKARQTQAGRVVALKMIRALADATPQDRLRFQIETEAVARLQHPNIVQLYHAGEADGQPFFSLEFVEGGALDKRLREWKPTPVEAAGLVESLARAMHYAHLRGVVHRDLKPANVLLTKDGEPKIADFGLAKRLDPEGRNVSQSGAVMGTPAYMAPEQAAGKVHDTGPAADVYALGAILYECLTGKPPFDGPQHVVLLSVLNDTPAPPSRLNAKVPRDLETICLKCLHKEPGKRYASAEALAEDLRRLLAGEPIRARPVGIGERLWRWCRRKPAVATAVAAAALALLVSVATLAVAVVLVSRSRDDQTRARVRAEHLAGEKDELARSEARERKKAQLQSARLWFEQGSARCEADAEHGSLLLARSLDAANAAEAPELETAARLNLSAWRQPAWQANSLSPRVLNLPFSSITAAAFSPDRQTIAFVARSKGNAKLMACDLTLPPDRHLFRVLPAPTAEAELIAFAADSETGIASGRDVGAAGRPEGQVWVWHWRGNASRRLVVRPAGDVRAVALSPDGKVALVGLDGTAQLYETTAGTALGPALPHNGPVTTAAFSPDGRTVMTGAGGSLYRWDVGTQKGGLARTIDNERVSLVAFSPDGKMLLAQGVNWGAWLYRADTLARLALLRCPEAISAAAFSPDAKLLFLGAGRTVSLWDTRMGRRLGPGIAIPDHQVLAAAFATDGRTIREVVFSEKQGLILRVWTVPTPAAGTPERVRLWVEVMTGKELDEAGDPRPIEADALQERRERLDALGGAPVK